MRWWVAALGALGCTAACGIPEDGLAPLDGAAADVAAPDAPADGPAGDAPDAGAPDAPFDAPAADVVDSGPIVTAGTALDFSGGSYVDMGVVPIPTDFTVEAWIHPTAESGETYVVAEDKRNQGPGQFRFGLASGKLFFIMSDASGATHGLYNGGYSLVSPQTIPLGVWTHVAVVKSGAAFSLTVNGAVAANVTADASFSYGGPPVAFRVAARVDTNGTSANGPFDGIIDEVRVWSVARTPTAVASTMSTTVPPSSSGLFAYWRFDEGTGTTTADAVNGTYPGTLVSGPQWVTSTAF